MLDQEICDTITVWRSKKSFSLIRVHRELRPWPGFQLVGAIPTGSNRDTDGLVDHRLRAGSVVDMPSEKVFYPIWVRVVFAAEIGPNKVDDVGPPLKGRKWHRRVSACVVGWAEVLLGDNDAFLGVIELLVISTGPKLEQQSISFMLEFQQFTVARHKSCPLKLHEETNYPPEYDNRTGPLQPQFTGDLWTRQEGLMITA